MSIISLQCGTFGNRLGSKLWEQLAQEHAIDLNTGEKTMNDDSQSKDTSTGVDVHFDEVKEGRLTPRCVLMDLEPSTLDAFLTSKVGGLFDPEGAVITGKYGGSNNFARGMYGEGADLMGSVTDRIRYLIERSSTRMEGFQLVHALAGGTGSGAGSLLLEQLRDEYGPKRVILTHTLLPSTQSSEVLVEPYNAVLASHSLIAMSDMTVLHGKPSTTHLLTIFSLLLPFRLFPTSPYLCPPLFPEFLFYEYT
jgi:tubulin beta